jgi:F-type H+-transporting ATPase subunit delta
MYELVYGYADAVLEDTGRDIGIVAAELEAFVDLLASSGDLEGVMGNSSVPVAVRRNVVHELLAKKVSAPTLQLLSFAVQSGAAADYAQDVAGIAVAAAAKRDGKVRLDDAPLGRTAAAERVDGYATAVLGPVKERQLGNIEDELFRFTRIVEGNDDLRVALTTNELRAQDRQAIVRDLLARRASPESARLAAYSARTGRPRDYPLLLDGLVERVAKEAHRRVADVRTAAEMTQAERSRLAAALTRFAGYPVQLRVTPQPDLLGGFVASIGDMVLDASLRHRLEQARELLIAPAPPAAPSPGEASPSRPSASNEH